MINSGIIFLFLHKNIWILIRSTSRGASNEYHNMFLGSPGKNFFRIKALQISTISFYGELVKSFKKILPNTPP